MSGGPTAPRALLAVAAAFALLTLQDVFAKALGQRGYGAVQIALLREMIALPLLLLGVALAGAGWRQLLPVRRWEVLGRSLCLTGTTFLFFWAVPQVPLTDAYTVVFTAPLFATLLAGPLLGEPVGWRRGVAVAVGFAGVLVAQRPGSALFGPAGLALLAAALLFALTALWTRRLAGEGTAAISATLSVTVGSCSALACLATGGWRAPALQEAGLILGLGLTGLAGLVALTAGWRRAPPVLAAPLHYTQLLWGALFDALLWATLPGPSLLLGAGLIVASGIVLLGRLSIPASRTAALPLPPTASA